MSTTTVTSFVRRDGTVHPPGPPPLLVSILQVLIFWRERRRQRAALAALAEDVHLLDDVGLSRAQALGEAGKPFWR
jgi:uncharacterized protein YjiS (DUF1127 family)